jgi:acetoin utilization deacetylase AcuC-like enzyme
MAGIDRGRSATTAVYSSATCLEHYAPGHPESPDRLKAALAGVRKVPGDDRFVWPELGAASTEPIEAVHGEHHVRRIADLAQRGGGWVDPDTFVAPSSYQAALDASWATVSAARDVLQGQVGNGLVLVRPPGHHATSARAMGFCLFNNVAIAAEWALSQGECRRVAILDVDVHHGNGTQEIFYRRPEVLYYSTHQFPFYPGTGSLNETGVADGVGATINVPLGPGCGDDTYLEVTERILTPALQRYRPDLIFVSLGFDAHWVDPLAQMRLTLAGYGEILERIFALASTLCDGRLVFILEGGYDLRVLEEGLTTAGCILAGLPRPRDPLGGPPPAPEPRGAQELVNAVCELHGLPSATGG